MLSAGPIRIVVIDDHPVVRDGVTAQLQHHGDMTVVGYAATAAEGLRVCAVERPDVVLLDLRLPDAPAAEVVVDLRRTSPESRVLVFTAFPEHASVASTLAAGACGLLVKDANGTTVRDAVRSVVRSGTYQVTHIAASVSPVTAREYDVLRLVAAGHTNLEIGAELNLSVNTVKSYLGEVMRKLGARNRAQVIMKARSSGLL
ncbi:response regulator transcription factor [Streptomyces sp. DSM 3412]|uniref:Response regulator transcription factor n=1 Tax=Streptomyces gottesmaniae TaxID=3075518 RepID=A0ABU2YPL2_9ACTN|nr:response regulator transcription factor [Streptomyces sp. DSM 3412]MDT0566275.1 response regulator transcription factor [Streptomyces sp. DSM 3412]